MSSNSTALYPFQYGAATNPYLPGGKDSGGGFMGGVLDFLVGAASSPRGTPGGMLVSGFDRVRTGKRFRDYQKQQYLQQAATMAANAKGLGVLNPKAAKELGALAAYIDPSQHQLYYNQNQDTAFAQGANQIANGGAFNFQGGPAAQVSQTLHDWNDAQRGVANLNYAYANAPQAATEGQNTGLPPNQYAGPRAMRPGQAPMQLTTQTGQPGPGEAQLGYADEMTLRAGAQQQAQDQSGFMPYAANPFFQASDIPSNYASIYNKGIEDRQNSYKQGETNRSNRTDEGIAKDRTKLMERGVAVDEKRLDEQIKNGYYQAGGANPFAAFTAAQNIANDQFDAVRQQGINLGYIDKKTGRMIKPPGSKDPRFKEYSNYVESYNNALNNAMNPMGGLEGGGFMPVPTQPRPLVYKNPPKGTGPDVKSQSRSWEQHFAERYGGR